MERNKLRFEDEAPATNTAATTSGQIGPKSKRKRSRLREDSGQPRPSERLRQEKQSAPNPANTAGAGDPGGEGASTAGDIPPGNTSGNMGSPQSRKTLWGEEEQRSGADFGPGWPEVAERSLRRRGPKSKAQQKTEKSKLRMERTDQKLTAAKEKLAAQPPPKKPGMVKKLRRAAGRTAHGYVHSKIYQVEHENVGTEAAHKTELVGEAVGGAAIRYAKRRYHNRHSIRVQKLQTQSIKSRADYGVRAAAQEHPELQSNPFPGICKSNG